LDFKSRPSLNYTICSTYVQQCQIRVFHNFFLFAVMQMNGAGKWSLLSGGLTFEPTTSYSALTTYDGYLLALKMILYLKT
jgi:hypothetical protein